MNCDHKHIHLCQHPILHDLEITSSNIRGYWAADNTDLMVNREKVARKNLANTESAKIKTYLDLGSLIWIDNKQWVGTQLSLLVTQLQI